MPLLFLIFIFLLGAAAAAYAYYALFLRDRPITAPLSASRENKLLKKAQAFAVKKEYQSASALLAQISQASTKTAASKALVEMHVACGAWQMAMLELRRLLERFENQISAKEKIQFEILQAEISEKLGRYKDAAVLYARLAAGGKPELNARAGRALLSAADAAAARAFLEKALETDAANPEVLRDAAIADYHLGDVERALFRLKQCKAVERKDALARFFIGRIYAERRQIKEAIHELSASAKDSSLRFKSLCLLAGAQQAESLKAEAINSFEQALAQIKIENAETLKARFELGNLYEDKREFQNALDQWRIVSEADPKYEDVSDRISRNARYGHDRIADFKVLSPGEFETTLRKMMPHFDLVWKHKISGGQDSLDAEVEDKKSQRLLFRAWRSDAPAASRNIEDLLQVMQRLNFKKAVLLSASGIAASGSQALLNKNVEVIGVRQLMKSLHDFEKEFKK